MNHPAKVYSAFLCALAATGGPAFAQQIVNPVVSDYLNNTAMGTGALANPNMEDDGGCHNTASGTGALAMDDAGSYNTADGFQALANNTSGNGNSAVGYQSLWSNVGGAYNTAAGYNSSYSNTSGYNNTSVGYNSSYWNTSGYNNTAFGASALYSNTAGRGNAAQGAFALYSNTIGIRNLGIGNNALYANVGGSYNIALGFDAGYNVVSGSNNIEIGAMGSASDNGTIQIGVQGTQTSTTIAGIYNIPVTGSAVYVNSKGQLGVQASSERFKTDVTAMPDETAKIQVLRPVTFHYKTDPSGALQYGLIAEEVAAVYPELAIRGANGRIDGVRYEELAPILLDEIQRQQTKLIQQTTQLQDQSTQIQRQAADLRDMRQELAGLKQANEYMQAQVEKLMSKNQRVAMR